MYVCGLLTVQYMFLFSIVYIIRQERARDKACISCQNTANDPTPASLLILYLYKTSQVKVLRMVCESHNLAISELEGDVCDLLVFLFGELVFE